MTKSVMLPVADSQLE